jgi:hypothetical protein
LISSADELKSVESPDKDIAQKYRNLLDRKWTDIDVWPALIARSEEQLFAALRALFWPLAGTIAAFCIGVGAYGRSSLKGESAPKAAESDSLLQSARPPESLFGLSLVNLVVLGAGFGGCFLFEVNGFKWELTRFMIPGYGIGMLLAVASASHLLERHVNASRAKLWLAAFVMLVCFGPATFLAYTCIKNIYPVSGGFSFARRLERLVTRTGTGFSKEEYSAHIQGMLSNAVQFAAQRTAFGGVFTPFAILLRGTTISVEETNINMEPASQREALFLKLETLNLAASFDGVAVVDMVHENGADPDDCAFLVTIEHKDADPSTYKVPFKRRQKQLELGSVSRTQAVQRLLPWQ